jgi:hypothetical protein
MSLLTALACTEEVQHSCDSKCDHTVLLHDGHEGILLDGRVCVACLTPNAFGETPPAVVRTIAIGGHSNSYGEASRHSNSYGEAIRHSNSYGEANSYGTTIAIGGHSCLGVSTLLLLLEIISPWKLPSVPRGSRCSRTAQVTIVVCVRANPVRRCTAKLRSWGHSFLTACKATTSFAPWRRFPRTTSMAPTVAMSWCPMMTTLITW